MTAIQKIHDRIQKLLRLANNNSNPNEAAMAAAAAQRLMDEHKLTEAMLNFDSVTSEPVEDFVDYGRMGAPLREDGKKSWRWHYVLASALERSQGCMVYSRNGVLQIVGRPSDVETYRYMFGYLKNEIEKLMNKHGKGCGFVWRQNYCMGAAETIKARLAEERTKWKNEARAQAVNPQALVRINQALARMDHTFEDARNWAYSNLHLRTKASRSSAQYNPGARELGREHGKSIRLSNDRAGKISSGRKALGE